ncbi:transglycosylase SLT domain-containing protein [Clostridium ljungdahlii]
MADTMNDTLQGSLNKLKSKIDNVFITDISKTTLGKSMKNFIDSVNTNMPTIENNLAWVLNGALKIGSGIKQNWGPISDTVLEVGLSFLTLKGILTVAKFAESISVLGKLSAPILLISMSVGAAATGFKDIKEGNKGLGALMLGTAAGLDAMAAALLLTDMSLGPVILVGVAVAALATGIIYFKSNWAQTWINIKETTMEYVNPIIDKINGLITLLDKIPGVNIGKISDIKMSSDDIKMAQSLGMSPDQIQKLTGSENKIQSFKPTSGTQALTNMVSNNNNVYSWFPKTKYASGTDYATGGTALVGEKGPEIVNLPTGSQVIPAQQTASMLSNTNSKMGTGAAASQNGFNSSTKKLLAENKAIIMDYVSHQTVYGQNSVKNFSTAVLDREPLATTATNKVSTDNKNIMSNLANSALTYGTQIDTELGQGIKDSEGSLLSIVDDLATKVVQQFKVTFGIASPSKVMYRIGDFLGQGLINGMQANDINSFITKWIGDTSSLTQNGLGSVIGQLLQPMFVSGDNKGIISMVYNLVHNGLGSLFSSGGAVSGNVAEWLTAAIALTGAPMSWLPALEMIAMGESGGDPMSINTYDINAQEGHPSEGLMQLIQENMDDYHLPGMTDIFNPIENGAASIRLIEHDYGSPWNTPGVRSEMAGGPYMGYAGGTSNATPGIHLVGEKGPELVSFNGGEKVTPNNQLASISQKPYFAGGSDVKAEISPNISFNIYESKDPRATAQEVYKVLKQHFGDLFDEKMGTLKIQMGFR